VDYFPKSTALLLQIFDISLCKINKPVVPNQAATKTLRNQNARHTLDEVKCWPDHRKIMQNLTATQLADSKQTSHAINNY
jgi:hypothetical protein